MANGYNIGSAKGYEIVNKLQRGQSTNDLDQAYRPGDGSVWTKNQDDTISVMHNGVQMTGNVTYRPPETPQSQGGSTQQASRPASSDPLRGGNSGGSSSAQTPTSVYKIGSARGYEIANSLTPGQSTTVGDGSVWTKNADGTISVMHNGVQMVGQITYQPPVTMPTPSAPEYTPITTTPIVPGQSALVRPSQNPNRLTEEDIKSMYQQMQDAQTEKIDYTVQQAVDELNRAQEDAQKGFETQRNQVNIDAAQAKDAQVLYAAARGDRGGIAGRQYDSISNTAANNKAAITEAQQKLATDTARQIADLRAQGEFEKADVLLQIAQQQLAQLWELQQYNDNLILQEQQMAMQESQITGSYNGKPTIDVQLADRDFNYNSQQAEREWQQAIKEWDYTTAQQEREWAYQIAMQSIQAGITPDASTLAAAGISSDMASQLASVYKASLTAKSSGSGGTPTKKDDKMSLTTAKEMAEMGQFTDAVLEAFYSAGYNPKYLQEMYGYEPEPLAPPAGFTSVVRDNTTPTTTTTMNDSHFKASMQSISAQLAQGKHEAALSNIDRISNSLSESQLQQLKALCAKYGVELAI